MRKVIEMGSGMFPVTKNFRADGSSWEDQEYEKLKRITAELEDFVEDIRDSIYDGGSGGGQYDNAASDGRYMERIVMAIECLKTCYGTGRYDKDDKYTYSSGE